jgi:hypothetical protein
MKEITEKDFVYNPMMRSVRSTKDYKKFLSKYNTSYWLVGQKFGFLTVIKFKEKKSKHVKWDCLCICGNSKVVGSRELLARDAVTCGCKLHFSIKGLCNWNPASKLSQGESGFNVLYNSYKNNAKNRNLVFELTKEQFKILNKQNCFYCGKIPSSITKTGTDHSSYVYNGIDRKDNSKGYTIENSVSCCGLCNKIKHVMSDVEFLKHIKSVAKHQGWL